MLTALFVPPLCDPTQPPLGVSALAAYLRRGGRHNAMLVDANMVWFRRLLDPAIGRAALEAPHPGVADDADAAALTRMERRPELLDALVDDVRTVFRHGQGFFNGARYRGAREALSLLSLVHSRPFWPARCDLTSLAWDDDYADLDRLCRVAARGSENPFAACIEEVLGILPNLNRCGLFGISVTFETQWLAALTLARFLKARHPATPVLLGGAVTSYVAASLLANPNVTAWIDGVVIQKGEYALAAALDALEAESPLTGIVGLWTPDGDTGQPNFIDLADLPTPDFADLPLGDYLSPKLVLPLEATKGCEWGHCAYCDLAAGYNSYQVRPAELLVADITELRRRHGVRHFSFLNDSMHACDAAAISRSIATLESGVAWSTDLRLSPKFSDTLIAEMRHSGCVLVAPGLETTSDRIFKSARKGQLLAEIDGALSRFASTGIKVTCQVMMGFPGETPDEMVQTVDFLSARRAEVAFAAVSEFLVSRYSPIGRNPELWGIVYPDHNLCGLCYSTADFSPAREDGLARHAMAVALHLARVRELFPIETFPYSGCDAHSLLLAAGLDAAGLATFAADFAAVGRRMEGLWWAGPLTF